MLGFGLVFIPYETSRCIHGETGKDVQFECKTDWIIFLVSGPVSWLFGGVIAIWERSFPKNMKSFDDLARQVNEQLKKEGK